MAWVQKSGDIFDSEIGPLWIPGVTYPLIWSAGRAYQNYGEIIVYDYVLSGDVYAAADFDRGGYSNTRIDIFLLRPSGGGIPVIGDHNGYTITAFPQNNEFAIYRFTAAAGSLIASKSYVLPNTCTLRLEVKDGIVRALVDGVEELSVADATYTGGDFYGCIRFSRQAVGEYVHADNWGIGEYAADPVTPDPGSIYTDTDSAGALSPTIDAATTLHATCEYGDFDTIGTFRISGWAKRNDSFSLQLEDKRKNLKKKIPLEFYTRIDAFGQPQTYPNMEEDSVGDPIPIAYGIIYDARPVCIDLGLLKFKVAGHAIYDFLGVRVYDGNTEKWQDVSFASTDEANGEFTLSDSEWDREAKVAVDFAGKTDDSGDLIGNAASIVEDFLKSYTGVDSSEIEATVLAESVSRLYLGTDSDGKNVNARRPSMNINEVEEADKVIGRINALVGSYLFPDASGMYRYVVFEPETGNDCEVFDYSQGDLFSFAEEVKAEEIFSSVRVAYQYREQQDYSQIALYARSQSQYLQGSPVAVLLDENVLCDRAEDAIYYSQRSARLMGERQRTYRAHLSHRGWKLLPAQQIRIVYGRHGINQIFEVLEIKRNLSNTLRVEVLLGDMHGLGNEAGFLSDDAPVFPDSLGGGSAEVWDSGWTDEQKAWARQNVGYISDDNGFADPDDPDSLNTFIVV